MEVIILINVHMDGKRAIIDLRQIILDGQHPRFEVFEYVKKADVGTTFEIHTPRVPKPLIKGLEDLGLPVIVDEIEASHIRVITVKNNEI